MAEPFSGTIHDPGASAPPPPQSRSFSFQTGNAARAGLTMGSTLAMVISWGENHSIIWAIIHGILSWLYVIYHALTR